MPRIANTSRPRLDEPAVLEQLAILPESFPRGHFVNELTKCPGREGRWNELLAWWLMGLGLLGGAVLGAWSFGGPVAPPAALAAYDALPRRLLRLAHIAAIALPVINLCYVPWIQRSGWSRRTRRWLCHVLLGGTLGLPATLALAAFWPAAIYAAPAPALGVTAAVLSLALGLVIHPRRSS